MISHLVLENFKSFHCAELQFGPVTLLVGPNASGKSNVRDALRLLHAVGRGYSLSECLDGRYDAGRRVWPGIRGGGEEVHRRGKLTRGRKWYSHRPAHWPTTGSSIDIRLAAPQSPKLRYRLTLTVPKTGLPRVTGEALWNESTSKEVFSTHPSARARPSGSSSTMPVWYSGRGRAGKRKATLSRERPGLTQLQHEAGADVKVLSQCELLRTQLQGFRFLDLSPSVMREYSHKESGILGSRGENLSSAVWQLCQKKASRKQLLGWLQELTPHDVESIEFFETPTGEVLLKVIEPEGREISARSLSDGTLRYLALATALLSAEPGQVFFIEEIENGIHPTRLFLLIQMLEEMTTDRSVQVIATTHAPLALAYLDDETRKHALYCYRDQDLALSHVIPVMSLPHIQDALEVEALDRLLSTGWMEHAT